MMTLQVFTITERDATLVINPYLVGKESGIHRKSEYRMNHSPLQDALTSVRIITFSSTIIGY